MCTGGMLALFLVQFFPSGRKFLMCWQTVTGSFDGGVGHSLINEVEILNSL